MGLPPKLNIMLHQISWFTYAVSILSLITLYYLYIGLTFYRVELQSLIYKLMGKQPQAKTSGHGDLQLPDYTIMGEAQPDDVEFVTQDELSFGPSDIPDEPHAEQVTPFEGTDSRLIGDFSEMVSEVKTLIRVINESNESKENFEMLCRLIVQKYPALAGTVYQQQINDFLIAEGASQFPFPLTIADLENYWTSEN
jgi:hypothetical protein